MKVEFQPNIFCLLSLFWLGFCHLRHFRAEPVKKTKLYYEHHLELVNRSPPSSPEWYCCKCRWYFSGTDCLLGWPAKDYNFFPKHNYQMNQIKCLLKSMNLKWKKCSPRRKSPKLQGRPFHPKRLLSCHTWCSGVRV